MAESKKQQKPQDKQTKQINKNKHKQINKNPPKNIDHFFSNKRLVENQNLKHIIDSCDLPFKIAIFLKILFNAR